jgi:hypothetical protein
VSCSAGRLPPGSVPDLATAISGEQCPTQCPIERPTRSTSSADRKVVERAAAHLRRVAIADGYGYAGLPGQHLAFGLAAVLDGIARDVRDLDHGLRTRIVQSCRVMLGETAPPQWATPPRN